MSSAHSAGNGRVDQRPPARTPAGLIAFAWTLVGVPLAYGLYQTVKTATSLFTG